VVDAQGLRLPVRAIEGEHELRPQALAERMLGHERLQLPNEHRVTAEGEVSVDPLLEPAQAELVEPGDLGSSEGVLREVGEWRAAPEAEPLAKALRGRPRLPAGEIALGLLQQGAKAVGVELTGLNPEQVAVPVGLEPAGPGAGGAVPSVERSAQPRDVDLKRLDRAGGGLLPPELVDQPVAGHDLVRVQQEQREQGPLPRTSEIDPVTVLGNIERAKDAELHGSKPTLDELQPYRNRPERRSPAAR
jgi:hypothetical protein